MKKFLVALVVLAGGISIAVILSMGKPKAKAKPSQPPAAPLVDVLTASPKTIQLKITTQGTVQPRREIDIVSQVAGIIEHTDDQFAAGAFFSKDSTLLKIEDSDYRFALIRTAAKIAEAEQLLATERARASQAKKEWRDLGQQDANALFLREPQLASAKAQLLAAEADRNEAKLNLQRTEILSPFNSRIRIKYVDEGQYVSPGTPIAKLYSTDSVEVRLPLTDKQLALIEIPGIKTNKQSLPTALISADYAGQKHQWQGRMVRTEASIDIDSRVVYAIVEVDKPFQASESDSDIALVKDTAKTPLTIGLFVKAEIDGHLLDSVIELPRIALQVDQKVLVLDEDNRLKFRSVNILQSDSQRVLIDDSIRAGERIVISNLPMAIEGMLVAPRIPAGTETKTPADVVSNNP